MKRFIAQIRGTRAAFTLMEVNLAIFIMAVGVLAMTALYPLGFRESQQARDDVRAAIVADEVLGKLTAALSSRNIEWQDWKSSIENAVSKSNQGGAGNGWLSYFNQRGHDTFVIMNRPNANSHAQEVFNALASAANGATQTAGTKPRFRVSAANRASPPGNFPFEPRQSPSAVCHPSSSWMYSTLPKSGSSRRAANQSRFSRTSASVTSEK